MSPTTSWVLLVYAAFSLPQLYRCRLESRQIVIRPNPLRNFEVREPPVVPDSQPCEKVLIEHTFGNSYGKPAKVNYSPPTECGEAGSWASVIFNLTTTSIGRQYDRLGLMYLDEVEVWRTSTAEPTRNGIISTVTRDMSSYNYLLAKSGIPLTLDIGNIVDPKLNLTGNFEVTLSAKFYPPTEKFQSIGNGYNIENIGSQTGNNMTKALKFPKVSNLFYEIKTIIIKNLATAFVQLFASGSGNEEFWYTNVPDEYYKRLTPTGKEDVTGKGPFREVQLWIDDKLAGVAYPFPVIYTGGILLSWWRPIAAIGAFDSPTYTIDITPFVPLLSDGAEHKFRIVVAGQGDKGSINSQWIFSGMVLTTLDPSGKQTTGKILSHTTDSKTEVTPPHPPESSNNQAASKDEVIKFTVTSYRKLSISSTVTTGSGSREVKFEQDLKYSNEQTRKIDQSSQTTVQSTTGTSSSKHGDEQVILDQIDFPFNLLQKSVSDSGAKTTSINGNLDHGYIRSQKLPFNANLVENSISTTQKSVGQLKLNDKGRALSGFGRTSQVFDYKDSREETYHRDVEISNSTNTIKDEVSGTLGRSKEDILGFNFDQDSSSLKSLLDFSGQPSRPLFIKSTFSADGVVPIDLKRSQVVFSKE